MMTAIAHQNASQIGQHLRNDLEKVVLPEYSVVANLRDVMQKASRIGAMMSGSGPTVFGLATSRLEAEQIANQVAHNVADPDLELWVSQFTSKGVHLE
jgi:4-diphosphocytidyl-2-C-methyl-D-erythritol kinase